MKIENAKFQKKAKIVLKISPKIQESFSLPP